jgi:hypothetical protein
MQPLSHRALVTLIQHTMTSRQVNAEPLASAAGLNPRQLTAVLTNKAAFTLAIITALSRALRINLGEQWAQYNLWLYAEDMARPFGLSVNRVTQTQRRSEPSIANDAFAMAKTLIMMNPFERIEALCADIVQATQLPQDDVIALIQAVRNQGNGKGDYDNG